MSNVVIDHPKPRARRTLTLIAKSLQGLANMSSFGTKESWMEPMNTFLSTHRQEFKTYLDNICSISSSTSPAPPIPPSYSTPLAILQRLPPTSREGFSSLPYLIDHARNFAALINLWLDNTQSTASNIQVSDGDLLRFHNICVSLHERTNDCLNRAERAERPSSTLSVKWEELVEQLQGSASFEPSRVAAMRKKTNTTAQLDASGLSPTSPSSNHAQTGDDESSEGTSTPVMMKPSRSTRTRHTHASSLSASQTSITSASSHNMAAAMSRREGQIMTYTPTESPSASASAAEDETPPGSSDGLHFPPHPPFAYPPPHPYSTNSTSSFSTHPNIPFNSAHIDNRQGRPPRSAGGHSLNDSEAGSDEFTTALPRFDKDKEKERKERGLQKILPFKSRRKDKEKDKEKQKEKEKEKGRERERREMERSRDRSVERSNGNALGEYSGGSLGYAAGRREAREGREGGTADF
jgi:hypothetical protein